MLRASTRSSAVTPGLGYPVPREPHAVLLVARGAAAELEIDLLVLDQLLWRTA
jgi:hypothetical protein